MPFGDTTQGQFRQLDQVAAAAGGESRPARRKRPDASPPGGSDPALAAAVTSSPERPSVPFCDPTQGRFRQSNKEATEHVPAGAAQAAAERPGDVRSAAAAGAPAGEAPAEAASDGPPPCQGRLWYQAVPEG